MYFHYHSGEAAFHAMMSGFGWAKNPMVRRIEQLRSDTPVTLLYGSRSWVDNRAGHVIKEKRPKESYTDVKVFKQFCCHDQSMQVFIEYNIK